MLFRPSPVLWIYKICVETNAVILHVQLYLVFLMNKFDKGFGGRRVFYDIIEQFLDDAVERQFYFGGRAVLKTYYIVVNNNFFGADGPD